MQGPGAGCVHERGRTRQEADQMVHLMVDAAAVHFCHIQQAANLGCPLQQLPAHPLHGLLVAPASWEPIALSLLAPSGRSQNGLPSVSSRQQDLQWTRAVTIANDIDHVRVHVHLVMFC